MRSLSSIDCNVITRTHSELDLLKQQDVEDFFKSESIDCVFLLAGKVGGIYANSIYPAEFIYENITMTSNVIHNANKYGVKNSYLLHPAVYILKTAHNLCQKNIFYLVH